LYAALDNVLVEAGYSKNCKNHVLDEGVYHCLNDLNCRTCTESMDALAAYNEAMERECDVDDQTIVQRFLSFDQVCRECGGSTKVKIVNKIDSYFRVDVTCKDCGISYLIGEGNSPDEK